MLLYDPLLWCLVLAPGAWLPSTYLVLVWLLMSLLVVPLLGMFMLQVPVELLIHQPP